MTIKTIYIVRHGFRWNWDPNAIPIAPPTGIDGDPPLSKHGEEQALELANKLFNIKPKIDVIISSPFYRCIQTISPLAAKIKKPILLENGVGEWYGLERATHPKPASAINLKIFFPDVDTNYVPRIIPSSHGESIYDLHKRCKLAITKIIEEFETDENVSTIVICTHAATKIALGRALMNNNDFEVRCGTCSLDIYTRNNVQTDEWLCEANGDTSFLSQGEERHWDFEAEPYELLDRTSNTN